jgi:hypothetical protein
VTWECRSVRKATAAPSDSGPARCVLRIGPSRIRAGLQADPLAMPRRGY